MSDSVTPWIAARQAQNLQWLHIYSESTLRTFSTGLRRFVWCGSLLPCWLRLLLFSSWLYHTGPLAHLRCAMHASVLGLLSSFSHLWCSSQITAMTRFLSSLLKCYLLRNLWVLVIWLKLYTVFGTSSQSCTLFIFLLLLSFNILFTYYLYYHLFLFLEYKLCKGAILIFTLLMYPRLNE